MHYKRWQRNGDPVALQRTDWTGATCTTPGCNNAVYGNGLCDAHRQRLRNHDDTMPTVPIRVVHYGVSAYDRVMTMSHDDPSGCRVFTGNRNNAGYGRVYDGTRMVLAHRVVLAHHHGPSNLLGLHSCDAPACVNIDHLRWGTHDDNAADMVGRGRTRWAQGGAHHAP